MLEHRYNIVHASKRNEAHFGNPFRFRAVALHGAGVYSLIFSVIAITALSATYFFFFSSAFALTHISITSSLALPADPLSQLARAQFQKTRWGIIPQRNIFAFNTADFLNTVTKTFALANVAIEKDRPHGIRVTISEKPRETLWGAQGRFFMLDNQGSALGETTARREQNQIILYEKDAALPAVGTQVLKPEILSFIARVFHNEQLQPLNPQFFLVENAGKTEFSLKVGEGWRIKFDATADIVPQIANLKLTLQHAVPPDARGKLDYIDVRFGSRVYYKLK